MKKFITAAALLAASGALASAATTTVDLVSLASDNIAGLNAGNTSQYDITLSGQTANSVATTIEADDVAEYLDTTTGAYYGTGTMIQATTYGYAPTIDTTVSPATFSVDLALRNNYYGTWAALVVAVSDILAENTSATIDDLTTVAYTYTISGGTLTAWLITDGEATQLTLSSTSGSIDVSDATEDSTIVFLYSTSGSATTGTLTATATIPEPSAFGLLAGVGALALVAARRRRTRKA